MLGQILDGRYEILEKIGEGAFGETYLAQDHKRPSHPQCVVKRLRSDIPSQYHQRVIEFFHQEAAVLEKLGEHPQIPQLLAHFAIDDRLVIVQEYILGTSLRAEIVPGKPLSEEAVMSILQDILPVLAFVHRKNVVHRDIKPENIIRQPDGKLVLIDFGAVKELGTLIATAEGGLKTSIVIGTTGYMPSEQIKGRPQLASDVYAVGMMAIEALTGIPAPALPEDSQTGEVIWRDRAQISDRFAWVLESMVRERHTSRYPSAIEALEALNQVFVDSSSSAPVSSSTVTQSSPITIASATGSRLAPTQMSNTSSRSPRISPQLSRTGLRSAFPKVLMASLLVTFGVVAGRSIGLFQSVELNTFDHLLRWRPSEPVDDRLFIVTIDEADRQTYGEEVAGIGRVSISDRYLNQLLQKLNQEHAVLIGLDLYRDFPVDPNQAELAREFQQNPNVITVCKTKALGGDSIAPPPDAVADRIGFSDFVVDSDDVLRRHLLAATSEMIDPDAPCTAPYAFSTLLAFRYLQIQGLAPDFTSEGNLQLGNTIFMRLQPGTGAYERVDAQGNQVLLNYRSAPTPARQATLRDVLSGRTNPAFIRNRIVLVGVTADSAGDIWRTPLDDNMPGVVVQAHMLSQILSAVTNRRPLIWAWSSWVETLWIGVWSVIGGVLGWYFRSPLKLGLTLILASGVLIGICWGVMTQAGWIPLVPPLIGLLLASGIMIVYFRSHIQSSTEAK
ncbi:MAG: CHASE2 domain-containing protein [Cyanobacteria bacterium CRU_2_1]|nr:CHASE2 domain-containing protein [Cyanobacteria bacterium RU_5_0]NJR58721.1 CHASE2 domain-containing protein [Cyanobacteria bacterium CRU_2_1]